MVDRNKRIFCVKSAYINLALMQWHLQKSLQEIYIDRFSKLVKFHPCLP